MAKEGAARRAEVDVEETVAAIAVEAHHIGPRGLVRHYLEQIARRPRRERLFLAAVSFFLTAVGVRILTLGIHLHVGPFGNVSVGGKHVHHLVWGIIGLLLVGYVWLDLHGTRNPASDLASRVTALVYGAAAALTLDEFALWLNLKDVYWEAEGRQSIEAMMAFFGLLLVALGGAPLFHAMAREWGLFARHVWRRRKEARAARTAGQP